MKKLFLMLFCAAILGSCAMQLRYFKTEPVVPAFDRKISTTLNIVFKEDVQDTYKMMEPFTTDGGMYINHYRKSLRYALDKAFGNNFQHVVFNEKENDTALNLILYKITPKLIEKPDDTPKARNGKMLYLMALKYNAVLYYKSKMLNIDNSEVTSRIIDVPNRAPLFIEATKLMCEHINNNLFTKEVRDKIR